MSEFKDLGADRRYQQGFANARGAEHPVWADYAVRGHTRVILHVEAHPSLRGTGAAGTFMKGLAEHARAEGYKLEPHCSYAAIWLRRHPEYADVLSS